MFFLSTSLALNHCLKVVRSTRNPVDWERYKSLRQSVKSNLRSAEIKFVQNEIFTNKGDSNALYGKKDKLCESQSLKTREVLAPRD